MVKCEKCLYNKNCQFLSRNKNVIVEGCTAFEDVANVGKNILGEWIKRDCISENKRGRVIHYSTNLCSVCGKWNGRHAPNYCPNCGAKMDGKEE